MQSIALTDATQYITLTLTDTSWVTAEGYVPATPEPGKSSLVESVKVFFFDVDTAVETAQELTRMLKQAERWNNYRLGKRIWVEFQARPAEDTYRSRVIRGRVIWDKELWLQMAGNHLEMLIIWEREPWWETVDEVEIPLTNAHGTDDTAGLTVYGHNDDANMAAHDNFVGIDGDDITGDLPSPVRLEIKNTNGDGTLTQDILIGHHIYSPTPHLSHVFEGEAATAGASGTVTSTAEGGTPCSDDLYGAITTSVTTETRACYWTLSSSDQVSFAGGLYRIFARFRSFPAADCYARIKVQRTNDVVIWSGTQIALATDKSLQELGTLRLPPDIIPTGGAPSQARLALFLQLPAATTVQLDYIAIMPLDGWRQFDNSGITLAQNDILVDDGTLGEVYVELASSAGVRGYGSRGVSGEPIMVWPDRDQQLYFLFRESDGKSGADRTHTIKASHHPRRATL